MNILCTNLSVNMNVFAGTAALANRAVFGAVQSRFREAIVEVRTVKIHLGFVHSAVLQRSQHRDSVLKRTISSCTARILTVYETDDNIGEHNACGARQLLPGAPGHHRCCVQGGHDEHGCNRSAVSKECRFNCVELVVSIEHARDNDPFCSTIPQMSLSFFLWDSLSLSLLSLSLSLSLSVVVRFVYSIDR